MTLCHTADVVCPAGHDHNAYTPTIGTTEYHAPELLDFKAPDELRQGPRNAKQRVRDLQACDVWAAAVVAFFGMTGTDLYYLNCDGPTVQEQVVEQQKALVGFSNLCCCYNPLCHAKTHALRTL